MSEARTESALQRLRRYGIAAALGGVGIAHLTSPEFFEAMVPDAVPMGPGTVNTLAAVAELGMAGLLVNRRTAHVGALAATAWFAGIWPVHWIEASNGTFAGQDVPAAVVWSRVAAQVPLIWASWLTARATRPVASDPDRARQAHG